MALRNKVIYHLVKTAEYYVEDSGMITTYGISCRGGEDLPGSGQAETRTFPDISTKSAFVEELVDRLNNHEADPIHLLDLIEDYLL